jgi:aspartyl-tRNA(Asn)/glutamyl-tRNA(Gln) amidotransferase subunit A
MDLTDASIAALADELQSHHVSAVELVRCYLARVLEYDSRLGAFITVDEDRAIAAAGSAQSEIQRGEHRGSLHGIPIAVKDMLTTAGLRTTAGSRILSSWIPNTDADAIVALRRDGVVVLGKTHTTEFAVWGTGGNSIYRLPRNPWDMSRIPGGSSGGSAVAVAARLAPAALATDTGGSARIPAALCGVVGFKPTRNIISTDGVISLSWSHDHVGLITRTVADCRTLLGSLRSPEYHIRNSAAKVTPRGLRIGLLPCPPTESTRPVQAAVDSLCERALELGGRVNPVGRGWTARAAQVSPAIQYPELAAYHKATFGAQDEDYGPDVRTGLAIGRTVSAVEYLTARSTARQLQREVDDALCKYDVLVGPTVPFAALPLGTGTVELDGVANEVNAVISHHTRLFNITGHPAITIPWDLDPEGMPIGVQLIGPRGGDNRVLEIAELFEQVSQWPRDSRPAGKAMALGAIRGGEYDHLSRPIRD